MTLHFDRSRVPRTEELLHAPWGGDGQATESDYRQAMRRLILLLPLAMITVGMPGCTAFDHKTMAGTSVDTTPLAPAVTEQTPSPESNNHNPGAVGRIVQVGDVLAVSVSEDPSFNGYYEVRLGGYIILPAIGRIDAMGLPLKMVQANVTKALEETQLPHATVKVTELGETRGGWPH